MCLLRAEKLLFSIELETLQSISSDSINLKLESEDKNITEVKKLQRIYALYYIYYVYVL